MNATISKTGFWDGENAHKHHVHSEELADYIAIILAGEENEPIYDLGCGMGFYLKSLEDKGFKYLLGFEGDPPKNKIFTNIIKQDLTQDLDIPIKGNVICLEVLEHIPAEFENQVLQNIVNAVGCNKLLILSWAVRGQAGYGHVNCRDNEEVIEIFEELGFKYMSYLSKVAREKVGDNTPWFRNTIMIFKR